MEGSGGAREGGTCSSLNFGALTGVTLDPLGRRIQFQVSCRTGQGSSHQPFVGRLLCLEYVHKDLWPLCWSPGTFKLSLDSFLRIQHLPFLPCTPPPKLSLDFSTINTTFAPMGHPPLLKQKAGKTLALTSPVECFRLLSLCVELHLNGFLPFFRLMLIEHLYYARCPVPGADDAT